MTEIEQSEWKNTANKQPKSRVIPEIRCGKHEMVRQMEQAQVVASWQSVNITSPDKPIAWIGNQLLGGSMSSILFREIREKRGLAYSIGSHLSTYTDTGLLSISCSTMPEQLEPCLDVLQQTIADVCQNVPTDMVQRAQHQLTVQFRMGMDSVEGAMLQLGALLDERKLYSPLEWVDKVNAVQPEQVQLWLKRQLETDALWTIVTPERVI